MILKNNVITQKFKNRTSLILLGLICVVYSGWSIKARERSESSVLKLFGIVTVEKHLKEHPEARSVQL